eukprot:362934-Chlamydomonas_euryale.AAC.4
MGWRLSLLCVSSGERLTRLQMSEVACLRSKPAGPEAAGQRAQPNSSAASCRQIGALGSEAPET